ncbi:hypothetical protein FACS1894116_01430 [Betaproteobacteria bacterium]|nr:hypothetical protein FACS1894116_01430 [Betaproteobacteria bacterium]GHU24930.1 hypothetical protein FACS189488_10690 [Betaproteobacteria bacterium]GHU28460.1 hypothetical protein FACS189497_03970 [Betaproteobacteria bacterium]
MKFSDAAYKAKSAFLSNPRSSDKPGFGHKGFALLTAKIDKIKQGLVSGVGDAFCVFAGDHTVKLFSRKSDAVRAARKYRDKDGIQGVRIKQVVL